MNHIKTANDNPMTHVVAYGRMLLAEMERAWHGRATTPIDWERMADLGGRRFCTFVRDMSWQVIQIGRKPEYFEEGSRVLGQFLTLTSDMLAEVPPEANHGEIEKIRTARIQCTGRLEWFERKKHESIAFFARINEVSERLARS